MCIKLCLAVSQHTPVLQGMVKELQLALSNERSAGGDKPLCQLVPSWADTLESTPMISWNPADPRALPEFASKDCDLFVALTSYDAAPLLCEVIAHLMARPCTHVLVLEEGGTMHSLSFLEKTGMLDVGDRFSFAKFSCKETAYKAIITKLYALAPVLLARPEQRELHEVAVSAAANGSSSTQPVMSGTAGGC